MEYAVQESNEAQFLRKKVVKKALFHASRGTIWFSIQIGCFFSASAFIPASASFPKRTFAYDSAVYSIRELDMGGLYVLTIISLHILRLSGATAWSFAQTSLMMGANPSFVSTIWWIIPASNALCALKGSAVQNKRLQL